MSNPSLQYIQRKATQLERAFASLGVSNITNLASPVRAVEESGLLDSVYKNLPDPNDIPAGCREYATLSDTFGAWCSAYQVGYWPKAYSYDVSSAYPSFAATLLSLKGADYKYSKTMIPATYGFVKGILHIDPKHPYAYCSPIVSAIDNDTGNPVGVQPVRVYELGQIRYLEQSGMGTFDLTNGWFVNIRSGERPLEEAMNKYYNVRSQGELMSMLGKRVIAGIIGRLGQFIDDAPTKYTNPVYHSIIRNTAPIKVHQCLRAMGFQQKELIHVNTDGFRATVPMLLKGCGGMGQWRGEAVDGLMVLSPDTILEGADCDNLIVEIKKDKEVAQYGEIDLMKLSREQNRWFKSYPECGSDLLKKHFTSQPIVLD